MTSEFTTISDPVEGREAVVGYLRQQLIGPASGDEETLTDDPTWRYSTAVLYPQEPRSYNTIEQQEIIEGATGEVEEDEATLADDDAPVDTGVGFIHQMKPASVGISFFLSGAPEIEVSVSAAQYVLPEPSASDDSALDNTAIAVEASAPVDTAGPEPDAEFETAETESTIDDSEAHSSDYHRKPLGPLVLQLTPSAGSLSVRQRILEGAADLHVLWRRQTDGWLVTVTLINAAHRDESRPRDPEKCLFQVELSCAPAGNGRVTVYPHVSLISDDLDDQILNVLYRHENPYAVGHGCASNWDAPVHGSTGKVWIEFLPAHKVPDLTFELEGIDREVLSVAYHANSTFDEAYFERLQVFLAQYRGWIDSLRDANADIPLSLAGAVDELLKRLTNTASRIESGILTLAHHSDVARCFQMANHAMLLQRQFKQPSLTTFSWRPFQLAFLLMTLPSVAFENDPDRSTVDLIWFPTGGGKTEAYLAMTAFLIFLRRLNRGSAGAGTAVIMRYTLRLLTTQQFQRAAALICACELLRRQDKDHEFGDSAISIGLWVGQSTTPNTCQAAVGAYEKLLLSDPPKSDLFPLSQCPYCGTAIIPVRKSHDHGRYGIIASPHSFDLYCPEPQCEFHEGLPVQIVDEMLYRDPPSLLIATVDKFARLPWEENAGSFFGGTERHPPELVIQDELHLISGPLGTIVGLYETAVDGLTSWRAGFTHKVIASTATIRRATEQCKALYNREVALFPPSGLNASDSYFARYDTTRPGRLYLGAMPSGLSNQQTQIMLTAALLQSPFDLHLEGQAKDAFWTLVTYHNTLRETGRTLSFIRDEIPERQRQIMQPTSRQRKVTQDEVVELTSNGVQNLGEALARLERTADDDDGISFVACTNMLSVGVDVQRLGLMMVLGQPKTASEYIQASSRVGRGVPGLIVTSYFSSRPRDRSHFEQFHSYHAALYRHVEPTSVTPFSPQARERALHAVFVTLIRHQPDFPMAAPNRAKQFRAVSSEAARAKEHILERIRSIDVTEVRASEAEIEAYIAEWHEHASRQFQLDYKSSARQKAILLLPYDSIKPHEKGPNWRTLNSMRHVDRNSLLWVIQDRPMAIEGGSDDTE